MYPDFDEESVELLEDVPQENEEIEDEPEKIDLVRFAKFLLRYWKIGLILMAVCGIVMAVLFPGGSTISYRASETIFVPPYTTREQDGQVLVIQNNLGQIENMVGLIESKMYKDKIAEQLDGTYPDSLGTFTVDRQEDTELINITASASSLEKAERLVNAVTTVMLEDVGRQVSIYDVVVVDPVRSYSTATVTSTLTSLIRGILIGFGLYLCYLVYKYFTDRTFRDREDVEDYLQVPVLLVLEDMDILRSSHIKSRNGKSQRLIRSKDEKEETGKV